MILLVLGQGLLISLRAADTTFQVKPVSAEQTKEYKLDAKFYKKGTLGESVKGSGGNGHYGGNAEVYMDVGEAMGRAMVELLKNK